MENMNDNYFCTSKFEFRFEKQNDLFKVWIHEMNSRPKVVISIICSNFDLKLLKPLFENKRSEINDLGWKSLKEKINEYCNQLNIEISFETY
jgi:hypothetical protein